jgi:hypothetical protein
VHPVLALQLVAMHVLAAGVPNPAPAPPPGTEQFTNDFLSWMKYVGLIGGVGGLMLCGIMMTVGRRNRHTMAVEGAAGIPWTLAGLTLVTLSAGITGAVLH